MKNKTTDEVRAAFLDFFKEKDHMIEPGASLVPINDPTLLWMNSGVAALKKYFDGSIKPENPRIANAQKCIRTSDIENVGKTARHATFFEMLGNFSIGDYFKEEAIAFGWEFFTSPRWMGFDPEKLYVSVHPDDVEAYDIWVNKIGFPASRILKSYDNYWQIGDGPCGPNSEIIYDRGEKYDPEGIGERLFFEELENDRYVEIWNIVFSQYDGKEGVDRKLYKELPHKNIDTGMGLERLTSIVQQKPTIYDTDVLGAIISAIEKHTEIKYGEDEDVAFRIIADHLRTVTFALADGAIFSNEGRGYILRRLLRRAVRYGRNLGISQAFMYQLVEVVGENMKAFYPYVLEKVKHISVLVKAEEERFHQTLSAGENLLSQLLDSTKDKILKGEDVFKLYDTYGFPLELTSEIAQQRGFTVDEAGFDECMEEQRQKARQARENVESMTSQSADLMDFTTNSEFIGYDNYQCSSVVIGLFKDGKKVDELKDEGEVIFDQTVFYAESGGQIADSGVLKGEDFLAKVTAVYKAPNKQHLLHIIIEQGALKLADKVNQEIKREKRLMTTRHHSSGHLLQRALKMVVGDEVAQAGSFVGNEYLRFDFTHHSKVSDEQLDKIEEQVNRDIDQAYPIEISYLPLQEAKDLGAIALFDEKYGEVVRVVKMGDISLELCGGSHVANTEDIGIFKIISEESIGSGIRRITATVSIAAYTEFKKLEQQLEGLANLVEAKNVKLVDDKVKSILHELEDLKKRNILLNKQVIEAKAAEVINQAIDNGECKVLIVEAPEEIADLKRYVENINRNLQGVVFAYQLSDKVVIACSCSPEAIAAGYQAGALVKQAATICEGNGGGRPDLASAGGRNLDKVTEMLGEIKQSLKIN